MDTQGSHKERTYVTHPFRRRPTGRNIRQQDKMGRIWLEVEVQIPGTLGTNSDRLVNAAVHEGFMGLLRELHETTRPSKIRPAFQPEPFRIPAGKQMLVVKLRTNSDIRLLPLMALSKKFFANTVTLVKDGSDAFLAERAARECRKTGVRVETPDDATYARICEQLLEDPPTLEDARPKQEEPVGTLPQLIYLSDVLHKPACG